MENNNNNNISVARIVSTGTTPESNHFIGLPDVVQDNPNASALLSMIQAFDWTAALARIQQFPNECQDVSFRGRTPLHVACAAHNVPEEIIRSLIKAYPQACVHGGTTGMNPLHIVCSSDHASANIVRILLLTAKEVQVQLAEQMCSMADADLDTPLHAACRCGAPLDVLKMLMLIYPDAVHQRDYEGLTPLLRLWVREYVLLGDEKINGVKGPADLVGELGEAWQKTMLLLYCSYMGSLQPLVKRGDTTPTTTTSTTTTTTTATTTSTTTSTTDASTEKTFRPLHAVATIDCPRRVVKIATIVHRDQLVVRDENGMYVILSCGACCTKMCCCCCCLLLEYSNRSFFYSLTGHLSCLPHRHPFTNFKILLTMVLIWKTNWKVICTKTTTMRTMRKWPTHPKIPTRLCHRSLTNSCKPNPPPYDLRIPMENHHWNMPWKLAKREIRESKLLLK